MVEGLARVPSPAPHGTHVEHDATLLSGLGIGLPENRQDPLRHIYHAPEVGVHYSTRLLDRGALSVAHKTVPGVVDENINPTEGLDGCGKSVVNGRETGDIEG